MIKSLVRMFHDLSTCHYVSHYFFVSMHEGSVLALILYCCMNVDIRGCPVEEPFHAVMLSIQLSSWLSSHSMPLFQVFFDGQHGARLSFARWRVNLRRSSLSDRRCLVVLLTTGRKRDVPNNCPRHDGSR